MIGQMSFSWDLFGKITSGTLIQISGNQNRSIIIYVSHWFFINKDLFFRYKEIICYEKLKMIIITSMIWTMDTTRESIDLKKYIVKRSTPDTFGLQLRDFCQLFRFYSSVILVIVGKDISLSRNKINRLILFFLY